MMLQESKANIMIIDDDPAQLGLLDKQLSLAGYAVRPFPGGRSALQAAESDPPDLILLDINMPEMDGYEVCRRFKQSEKLKKIPVIFLTVRGEAMDKAEAFSYGGIDYLTKPFESGELHARIETHYRLYRSQIEIERKNDQLQQALDELKAAQAQLVQTEKMGLLGILTAGIAHEINNPVNFMQASAQGIAGVFGKVRKLLSEYAHIEPDQAVTELDKINRYRLESGFDAQLDGISEMLENILSGAERTAAIVKGLLRLSRQDEAVKKPADIHENLDSVLVLLHCKFGDSITVHKEYGDIPPVYCYPGKLDQVFMNLLVNAIDAINAKETGAATGTINIKTNTAEKDGRRVVMIAISDSGPGIAEEAEGRLFDPFFTTKDVGEGTGLGLAITLSIIEEHGGSIAVQSEPGNGATFTVSLPLHRDQTLS